MGLKTYSVHLSRHTPEEAWTVVQASSKREAVRIARHRADTYDLKWRCYGAVPQATVLGIVREEDE
jgi:hypothetical protein